MDIDYFYNAFLSHSSEIECHHGLKLVWTGEFEDRYWGTIPIFRVENPNDSPYTFEALSGIIEDELFDFKKMVPISRNIKVKTLYEFDENQPYMYIPARISEKIKNCLRNTKIDASVDPVRLIGRFDGDFDFNMADSEMVDINLDFLLEEILLDGKKIDESHEAYNDWLDYFRYDNRDFLENEIWNCFDDLSTNKNFVDFDWMGWYTNFYIVT